ncbi:MAG: endonuclease V [Candidatus Latescibacterota bacterium]|nr:MAG: endonuclease V [Candidatus Latescibacterota bacterium]
MSSPDAWDVTPSEGIALQRRLARLVRRRWDGRRIRHVAGADVHFPARGVSRAAVTVLSYPGLELVEQAVFEGPCAFPYIPGLLSFREIPAILEAWRRLEGTPDVVLFDGQGVAHPRGLGLASHAGLVLGVPSVGCAKSPLFGSFEEPGRLRGARSPIRDAAGKTIGAVLRTRNGTRPIFVSVGHLMSLERAVEIVLSCAPRFRIPEPLRAAHRLASSKSG